MKFLKNLFISFLTLGLASVLIGLCLYEYNKVSKAGNSVATSSQASTKTTTEPIGKSGTSTKTTIQTSNSAKDDHVTSSTTQRTKKSKLPPLDIHKISKNLIVKVDQGNVRSFPGTANSVVKKIPEGTVVKATSVTTIAGVKWYGIKDSDDKTDWVSSEIVVEDKSSVLINTPVISQLPELQRGCEVTSLAMLLKQAGHPVDKMTLAKEIKTLPFYDGNYKSNPNDGFVGDIYTFNEPGLGVYHGPIANLAKKYLGDQVDDMTGESWSSIETKLNEGHAVWVIINSTFKPLASNDPYWYNWKTKEGTMRVTYKEHSVLVTGYNANNVFVNDPLTDQKNVELNKTNFIAAWKQMGSQAISY